MNVKILIHSLIKRILFLKIYLLCFTSLLRLIFQVYLGEETVHVAGKEKNIPKVVVFSLFVDQDIIKTNWQYRTLINI